MHLFLTFWSINIYGFDDGFEMAREKERFYGTPIKLLMFEEMKAIPCEKLQRN